MGIFYTTEQIQRASSVNLVSYLMNRGEKLVPSGRNYTFIYNDSNGTHDSVKIANNKWYDFKNQTGGDTIEFLKVFYNSTFTDAVSELLNGEHGAEFTKPLDENYKKELLQKRLDSFKMPTISKDMKRTFAYLIKTRMLDKDIVQHFVNEGKIVQEEKTGNVIFVSKDENGNIVGGSKKSTNTNVNFRGTILGSDTRFAFSHKGQDDSVFVFESAIDMLSYISLNKKDWQKYSYISLDGLSPRSLYYFLENNKDVYGVLFCLDNDDAGQKATDKMISILEKDNKITATMVPQNKDWNEDLIESKKQELVPNNFEMTM